MSSEYANGPSVLLVPDSSDGGEPPQSGNVLTSICAHLAPQLLALHQLERVLVHQLVVVGLVQVACNPALFHLLVSSTASGSTASGPCGPYGDRQGATNPSPQKHGLNDKRAPAGTPYERDKKFQQWDAKMQKRQPRQLGVDASVDTDAHMRMETRTGRRCLSHEPNPQNG